MNIQLGVGFSPLYKKQKNSFSQNLNNKNLKSNF